MRNGIKERNYKYLCHENILSQQNLYEMSIIIIFITLLYHTTPSRHRGIVVMDFDCYTGDHGLIPAHRNSLGK